MNHVAVVGREECRDARCENAARARHPRKKEASNEAVPSCPGRVCGNRIATTSRRRTPAQVLSPPRDDIIATASVGKKPPIEHNVYGVFVRLVFFLGSSCGIGRVRPGIVRQHGRERGARARVKGELFTCRYEKVARSNVAVRLHAIGVAHVDRPRFVLYRNAFTLAVVINMGS